MAPPHPLDRPVWSALGSGWEQFSQGDARAKRLDPAYGPFVASADGGGEGLAALIASGDEGWAVEAEACAPPPGIIVLRTAPLLQLVAETPAPAEPFDFLELGDDDAAEMRALAALARPGPFHAMTHRLGRFIGVREGGRLVAMAGERMRVPGFAEVSGVCTHPDARGRGHAGRLMRTVAARIVARGEVPFLHSYPDNAPAIALYGTLGYTPRVERVVTVLTRDGAA